MVGAGIGIGDGAGAWAGAGEDAGWGAGGGVGALWEAATALLRLASAATRAGGPSWLVPGPIPRSNAGGPDEVGEGYDGGREGKGEGGRMERPESGLQGGGAGVHRSDEATVEEKIKRRRAQLRAAAKQRTTSEQPPVQGAGSGSGGERGSGTGARDGGGAGRKRKASAAGALEAERAEKVRREVQWAHVRAAMCGVLRRAERKKAGRRRASVKRTGHAPGTAPMHSDAAPSQVPTVTVQEEIKEKSPKRKCKEVPPGTYAPIKRAKGMPPGRPPDPPP